MRPWPGAMFRSMTHANVRVFLGFVQSYVDTTFPVACGHQRVSTREASFRIKRERKIPRLCPALRVAVWPVRPHPLNGKFGGFGGRPPGHPADHCTVTGRSHCAAPTALRTRLPDGMFHGIGGPLDGGRACKMVQPVWFDII